MELVGCMGALIAEAPTAVTPSSRAPRAWRATLPGRSSAAKPHVQSKKSYIPSNEV